MTARVLLCFRVAVKGFAVTWRGLRDHERMVGGPLPPVTVSLHVDIQRRGDPPMADMFGGGTE